MAGHYRISAIYLFGSYARNEARKHSDIDVCVVSPDFENKTMDLQLQITGIAKAIDPRFDDYLTTPKRFKTDLVSPLLDQVRKYGIRVV